MKPTSLKRKLATSLAGLASLLPIAQTAKADQPNPEPQKTEYRGREKSGFDGVFRIATEHEHIVNTDQSLETVTLGDLELERKVTDRSHYNFSRLTLGFGLTKDCCWNKENGRIYFDRTEQDGETSLTIKPAYRQSFNLGDLSNEVLVFGQFGDEGDGLGLQTTHQIGKFGGAFNAEKLFRDYDLGIEEKTRLGFDADFQATDTLNFGIAYDTVKDSTDRDNYAQARLLWDVTPNDLVGLSYIHMDEHDVTTHRGIASWTHYGTEEKWGTRTWARLDHTPETETTSFKLNSWIGENPNVGRYHGIVPHSRRRGDIPSHSEVVDNALDFEVHQYPVYTNGGWSAETTITMTDAPGVDQSRVYGSVAHTWKLGDNEDNQSYLYVRPFAEGNFGDTRGWGAGLDVGVWNRNFFGQIKAQTKRTEDRAGMDHNEDGVYAYFGFSW